MSTSLPIPDQRAWPQKLRLTSRSALTPYDRFVALMRLLLPGCAAIIGLLALIWPLLTETEDGFTFQRDALQTQIKEIRTRQAEYTGIDQKNRLFVISAERAARAAPDADEVRLQDVAARLDLGAGDQAFLRAPSGVYAIDLKHLSVQEGMELTTSDSYELRATRAVVDLENKIAQSSRPIEGKSLMGDFRAGGFTLQAQDRILRLTDGVEMVIAPSTLAPKEAVR